MAEGLSNRTIAAKLVLSSRTLDGHRERILAKLGFTSRLQVASWVANRAAARWLGPRLRRDPEPGGMAEEVEAWQKKHGTAVVEALKSC